MGDPEAGDDNTSGGALPPPPDHESYREPLTNWLIASTDATAAEITEFTPPKSGYSAETLMFTARVDGPNGGEQRLVLRKDTDDDPVYPVQGPGGHAEVELQWLTMSALASHGEVPLAPLIGYEADPSVLGNPFFVMGFIDGDVPVENPTYTQAGFFADATPDQRRTLIDSGLEALAAVHRTPWRDLGFDWLRRDDLGLTGMAQLDLWESQCRSELDGRVHGPFEEAVAWLRANAPEHESEPVLCWGDPRPGNVIWQDFRPAALTDFEASSISPAEVDLGWWLMFDRFSHAACGQPDRLVGEPSLAEQVTMYEAHAGRPVNNIYWYELLAGVRYCAIVVRIMNRMVDRGQMPPDHTIWLENPATVVTEELLAAR